MFGDEFITERGGVILRSWRNSLVTKFCLDSGNEGARAWCEPQAYRDRHPSGWVGCRGHMFVTCIALYTTLPGCWLGTGSWF